MFGASSKKQQKTCLFSSQPSSICHVIMNHDCIFSGSELGTGSEYLSLGWARCCCTYTSTCRPKTQCTTTSLRGLRRSLRTSAPRSSRSASSAAASSPSGTWTSRCFAAGAPPTDDRRTAVYSVRGVVRESDDVAV